METRVAVIGIIDENKESVPALNKLLSEYGEYIIGKMGIPYKEKKKTKATEAIKNGLEPLAKIILSFPDTLYVDKFINENVKTKEEAIKFLMENSKTSYDECSKAYDFYINLFKTNTDDKK